MTLRDYVSKDDTFFDKNFNDWEAAIGFAGDVMVSNHYIKKAYRDDMIRLIKELGPYIVVMPGIALAHARSNGNVMENKIVVVTMPEGVRFGNASNDPVYLLLAIAAKSDQEHLIMFKTVADFFAKDANISKMMKAHCYEDMGI